MENSQLQFHMQMASGVGRENTKNTTKKKTEMVSSWWKCISPMAWKEWVLEWWVGRLFFLINEVKMFSANKFMRRAASKLW